MSGAAVTVFDRGDIDFGSPLNGVVMGDMPIAENVDISRFKEVVALVRLHKNSMASTGAIISLKFKAVLPSPEEPAVFFRESAYLSSTQIDIAKADLDGLLYRKNLGSNLGAMLSVFASATQGSVASVALKATISIVFSMKE